ncbi:MAG: hypothetical protein VXZ82_07855 [Planctomycetota bacterium]|nr:hypothetical protein [Planctomycetota bacterium]
MRGLVTLRLAKISFSIQVVLLIAIAVFALTRLSVHKNPSLLLAVNGGPLLLIYLINFTLSSMIACDILGEFVQSVLSVSSVFNAIFRASGLGRMAWPALCNCEPAPTSTQMYQGIYGGNSNPFA